MLTAGLLEEDLAARVVADRCRPAYDRVSLQRVGDSDVLLAARLGAGDDRALSEAFDRLGPAVYAGALRVLGDARAADAFHGLLRELPDADWARPALRDLDVQGLVGHLTGVEEDVQRCLAGDPAVAAADHVASTQGAAVRQAGRRPAETRAEWRLAADRLLPAGGQPDDPRGTGPAHHRRCRAGRRGARRRPGARARLRYGRGGPADGKGRLARREIWH